MANNLDSIFSAFSDPTRRAVIERLSRGPATVSDLAKPHDMALPTFMKHLKVLEASDLVRSEKTGRVRTCYIKTAPLAAAETWIDKQRSNWEGRLDRLETLATEISLKQQKGSPYDT